MRWAVKILVFFFLESRYSTAPNVLGALTAHEVSDNPQQILGTLRTPTTWYPTTYLDPDTEGMLNSSGVPGSGGPKSP